MTWRPLVNCEQYETRSRAPGAPWSSWHLLDRSPRGAIVEMLGEYEVGGVLTLKTKRGHRRQWRIAQ